MQQWVIMMTNMDLETIVIEEIQIVQENEIVIVKEIEIGTLMIEEEEDLMIEIIENTIEMTEEDMIEEIDVSIDLILKTLMIQVILIEEAEKENEEETKTREVHITVQNLIIMKKNEIDQNLDPNQIDEYVLFVFNNI